MSEYNPTIIHSSHRLAIYNFRYHSYIPRMYTTNLFHSHWKQKTGLKWASQLITQIWKLVYGKWLHRNKINHTGEALYDQTKEIILDD